MYFMDGIILTEVIIMKRVTKNECKPQKDFAVNILNSVQKDLYNKYKFNYKLVGSAVQNTILRNKNGYFDLDYQILLTKNSKEYKNNKLKNATSIKEDFFNTISLYFKGNNNIRVENSTTAITLINKKELFSIDFVIIKVFPENNQIIRRNNKRNSSINEYTWNQLPQYNEAYHKFKNMKHKEKTDLIENHILPRKEKEKLKNDGDKTKKSSCEIFIEEVNNYAI